MVTTEQVKELRDATGISVMECRKALVEAKGDREKALEILKKRSSAMAEKKSDRALGAGTVAAYVHANGTVGALVLLYSETDFVSKNEDFKKLAYDIAMHVAAMNPENEKELLKQHYVKDPSQTVETLINNAIQKFGEKVEIGGFSRYSV